MDFADQFDKYFSPEKRIETLNKIILGPNPGEAFEQLQRFGIL